MRQLEILLHRFWTSSPTSVLGSIGVFSGTMCLRSRLYTWVSLRHIVQIGCSDLPVLLKLTTHLHLLPTSRMAELYLHSTICLHGIMLNYYARQYFKLFFKFKIGSYFHLWLENVTGRNRVLGCKWDDNNKMGHYILGALNAVTISTDLHRNTLLLSYFFFTFNFLWYQQCNFWLAYWYKPCVITLVRLTWP
jgi:hypothetical protein